MTKSQLLRVNPLQSIMRWMSPLRRRIAVAQDLGQTAIVAVVVICVAISLGAVVLVNTVNQSYPLQQTKSVAVYANRALEAGENAYLTAINANPSLAQCTTNTNGSGLCSGINYGEWNYVEHSTDSGGDAEYYAFGNPQPTFDTTTNALDNLAVQVVGAAKDPSTTDGYLFDSETINVSPQNGFLQNVWWSNFESYSSTGNYSTCKYNWSLNYNINNANVDCNPVYFGPGDYLYGPVYTNDSVFVAGDGTTNNSPSFGTTGSASPVTTADPKCLFVDASHGMNGSSSNCTTATSDVAQYDNVNSSFGNTVEQPPSTDQQLGTIAGDYGCLYSGPTQITLSTNASGVGQMTVVSPDTPESSTTITQNGSTYTLDQNNIAANTNDCPNNGTAPLPSDGVVFVQNATSGQTQAWANPFDDPIYNTVTNLTSSPAAPLTAKKSQAVTLTATVTSSNNQFNSGATVAFSQTTSNGFQTSTSVIGACATQSLSTPTQVTSTTYQATATCSTTESSSSTGAFSAAYSGGTTAAASSANLGQTYTLSSSETYGPYAQVTAGGCNNCYYGETSTPDAEGDAFVNGSLSGQLTIGTANNVIIDGNISYADCASTWTLGQSGSSAPSQGLCPYNVAGTNDTLGLIAYNYVEVNRPVLPGTSTIAPPCTTIQQATCDQTSGSGLTVDAAILALTQSFVVNNYGDGSSEGQLTLYGSIQQYARGPVGTFNNGSPPTVSSGYQKHYTWDPLLDFVSPPSYLTPSTASWVLTSVNTNAGVQAGDTCPPIDAPFPGINQPVTYITGYCTASTGGLPGFPAITVPSSPYQVTASANNNGTATVGWVDPVSSNGSTITGYTVAPTPNCGSCSGTSVSSPTATQATVTGLTPGGSYTFTVSANSSAGASSPSTASNSIIIPNVPSAPTNVAAAANADGSLQVTWTDPANGGSPITGYTVTPTPACSSCAYTSLSGAAVATTNVTGVTPGTSYTFKVTATNAVGSSSASAASNSVTAPTVPGAPTGVSATASNGTASVTWTAPVSNGGSAITGYVITPYIGTTAQTAQTFVTTSTTQTVTGLTNGTAYTFKVAAYNGVGTGAQSAASGSVTPVTVPGAPTIGTATAAGSSATLTWTAPTNTGGSPITGYVVTPYVGALAQTAQTFTSTATTQTVTGLTNGTTYTFYVAATNAVGTGSQSGASNAVTPYTTAGAPTGVSATASNVSANVSWTAPSSNGGSAITGYVITPYIGTTAQTAQTFSSTATSETATGLTAGTAYTFKVAAINAAGTGAQSTASGSVTPYTVPGAPTIGTATVASGTSATLTWTAPSSTGGSAITGYVVTPYIGTTAQTAQSFSSTATSQTITGLTNGTAYTFKVAATNAAGTGTQSAASGSVTPATVPGAPTSVAGTGSGTTQVNLTWVAPSSTGGSAITGYVVTPYLNGTTAQTARTFTTTAVSQAITGLTASSNYTFKVAATNVIGTGTQSTASATIRS